MKIGLIVAMDKHNGIGVNNDLPWRLHDDMSFFKDTTINNIVLMGRKNYISIPERFRPLPNRENIILTKNNSFDAPGCIILHSIKDVLKWIKENEDDNRIFYIIGGAEIYKQFIEIENFIDEMYITKVNAILNADVFFPEFDEYDWNKKLISSYKKDDKNEYDFNIWHYFK